MVKQRPINKSYKRFEKDSGGSSGEETELFVRNKSLKKEIPTVEKNIEDGDTLQSLAIRYRCTVEELKRLNQIHKDNEIFAKRTIKVPHRPFSEALAAIHTSGTVSPHESDDPSTSRLIDIETLDTKLEGILSKDNEVNEIIFNSNIAQKTTSTIEEESVFDADEDVQLLPQRQPEEVDSVISRMNCNGTDGDISLPALIIYQDKTVRDHDT
ncbi:hypothetical protein GWI33_016165 [Rhynchophorus ferrugineus]|uniref:LysM domain-containing protein n=1 Tax=Rhynchophorus ferrugineus TaxID=354439 RepID=A0A834I1B8_RHYFE|nr:hypothetical protein GWI33_016165 [Rhynchophorus ferrugineus]